MKPNDAMTLDYRPDRYVPHYEGRSVMLMIALG